MTLGRPVDEMDEVGFQAQLAPVAAAPPLNLRQGGFARRRQWKLDQSRSGNLILLALAITLFFGGFMVHWGMVIAAGFGIALLIYAMAFEPGHSGH